MDIYIIKVLEKISIHTFQIAKDSEPNQISISGFQNGLKLGHFLFVFSFIFYFTQSTKVHRSAVFCDVLNIFFCHYLIANH